MRLARRLAETVASENGSALSSIRISRTIALTLRTGITRLFHRRRHPCSHWLNNRRGILACGTARMTTRSCSAGPPRVRRGAEVATHSPAPLIRLSHDRRSGCTRSCRGAGRRAHDISRNSPMTALGRAALFGHRRPMLSRPIEPFARAAISRGPSPPRAGLLHRSRRCSSQPPRARLAAPLYTFGETSFASEKSIPNSARRMPVALRPDQLTSPSIASNAVDVPATARNASSA